MDSNPELLSSPASALPAQACPSVTSFLCDHVPQPWGAGPPDTSLLGAKRQKEEESEHSPVLLGGPWCPGGLRGPGCPAEGTKVV